MQLNINGIKQNLCRQMALVDLIEKSQERAKHIACGNCIYYSMFGAKGEQDAALSFQNKVTQRLVDYLYTVRKKEAVQC